MFLPGAPFVKATDVPGIHYAASYIRILAAKCPDTALGYQRSVDLKSAAGQLLAEIESTVIPEGGVDPEAGLEA